MVRSEGCGEMGSERREWSGDVGNWQKGKGVVSFQNERLNVPVLGLTSMTKTLTVSLFLPVLPVGSSPLLPRHC